jgi:adenine specific DNA methylase Mod
MSTINFNNKIFYLKSNSNHGTSNADTIFHYQQKESLVTANFSGGSVQFGTIIAIHHGDYLDMIYQMLTTANELKSGKAIAKISIDNNEKIQLDLNWEWLVSSEIKGTSIYCEQ